jgi:hypothetical protein
LSINNNNNNSDYTNREKQVIDLYKLGKTTREIAKILRMSLRDTHTILKNAGLSHGITTTAEDNDNNNKSSSIEKATEAYRLFSEGRTTIAMD